MKILKSLHFVSWYKRSVVDGIRNRRGEPVAINIPVFRDTKTPSPLRDDGAKDCCNDGANTKTNLDFIHMDHTIYGSGCCCLQVTFQAKNLGEAKVLYDQLAPFCPIMLALSAGSPLWKGFVSDYDTRWPAFIQSLDDRTHEERRVKYGTRGHRSTRAGSVDCYLTSSRHNDKVSLYDEKVFTKLKSEGVDELLAKQISHEFIHDPITLYKECLEQEVRESDIFETVHSTNWRMLRLKLPIPEENTGWRIEFRPMDVQLTDYENAAYVVFVTLLTRVILEFNLDFTVPLSKVDFNMESASRRNAVLDEKFYFNKKVEGSCPTCGNNNKCVVNNNDDRYILMTIDEIMHGKDSYQGIIFYMKKYLKNTNDFNKETEATVMKYLDLISDRARGTEKTRARWIRDFVDNHPNYQHDSVVSDVINYDLLVKCAELSNS